MTPTTEEVRQWVTDTVRHAYHIEYFLQRLQIGTQDKQRPHDIVGVGNKLEWEAIKGFALQYRGPHMFQDHVLPSLEFHRQQDHHCAWNSYNANATPDAMKLGAVDACCSLLEPRAYQGGCHTYSSLYEVANTNPIHKTGWMLLVGREMELVEQPRIDHITIDNVPTLGLSPESHDILCGRISECREMLDKTQGIKL